MFLNQQQISVLQSPVIPEKTNQSSSSSGWQSQTSWTALVQPIWSSLDRNIELRSACAMFSLFELRKIENRLHVKCCPMSFTCYETAANCFDMRGIPVSHTTVCVHCDRTSRQRHREQKCQSARVRKDGGECTDGPCCSENSVTVCLFDFLSFF